MKTKKNFFFSIVATLITLSTIFNSCNKDESILEVNSSGIINENEYNTDLRDFALAVSEALKTNTDFRKIVKDEAVLMVDGDYDVILRRVMNKEIKSESPLKSTNSSYTVKDLLENSFSSFRTLKSSSSIIEELSIKYPYLQIAIPVHAENWDEENYIPTVTFLPLEYDDATTTSLTGYDSEGRTVTIDAINEPEKPVIVISQNERIIIEPDPNYPITPSSPSKLTGIQTESGIRLTWEMPSGTTSANTTGYYVYRKDVNSPEYSMIKTVSGANNRSFDDSNIEASRSYSYYVVAYKITEISEPSNYITVSAPNYPKPVVSFDAILQSKNEIELRWENDHNQYIQETRLSKHIVGQTNGYQTIKSFSANEHGYFDNEVPRGQKVIYKITHITEIGESNAKYDFIQVPYRDILNNSPVYIKKITFSDWKIERWPAGKPEFYIKVTNVDQGGKTPFVVQEEIDCQFSSRSSTSQVFYNKWVLDWKPGFWFDMLTFTAIEYDRPSSALTTKISVGYNSKDEEKQGFYYGGAADYEITFSNKGEECLNSYLNYFDNPEKWIKFPNYGVEILLSESDN